MRSILATALLAVPSLLPAQAMHTGISQLVASVDAPAVLSQASAVNAAAPHIYTGLIAPVRLNAMKLAPAVKAATPGDVTVEYTVDTAGIPQNVHVTKKLNVLTDEQVVEAVKQIRYTPGTLNGSAVAVPVTLHVAIQ